MILTREKKEIWSSFEKMSFRFLFLYFSLYVLSIFTSSLWEPVINWIGTFVFNIDYDFSSNGRGSGDTTYAYLMLFLFLCFSILGNIIWSFLDRKRKSYNQLQYGLLVGLRFILIFFMFTYGIVKIFHLQMPALSNSDLISTFGNKSPMGLAWDFMGFSKTYSVFAGLAEVTAGILLISRRTQTYGAIATIVVMLNVFMMNLCFDIPVKIFSFHLMLMGILILMADFKRFFGVVVLNKNINNYTIYPQQNKEDRKIIMISKTVLFLVTTVFFILTSYPRYKKRYLNSKSPLYGIWQVTKFQKNRQNTFTESSLKERWNYITIDQNKYATIKTLDDKLLPYKFTVDTVNNNIFFGKFREKKLDTLTYQKNDSMLFIKGVFKNDTLNIQLKFKSPEDFLLKSRGFHWVNEYPLNR
ncbi:hypothetical protein [uncultured Polaribacter sp.]|uniref:DoxX family protein n=1 Tax=uncultured Polaribacter sp. TaxID=174711 RepID=UPI00259B0364|nr:hypothetical protein [uncultured Polaribacter sp.]